MSGGVNTKRTYKSINIDTLIADLLVEKSKGAKKIET